MHLYTICGCIFLVIFDADSLKFPITNDRLSDTSDNLCCVKKEWEGLMYLDYGTVFIDQNTAFAYINGSVRIGYSLSRQKIYFKVEGVELSPLIPKPAPMNSVMLYDFSKGISYVVVDGQCQKSDLQQNMTLQCIPKDATLLSSAIFGTKEVYTYQFETLSDIEWQITASVFINDKQPIEPKECTPVFVTYFTPSVNPDSGSLYSFNIMDIGPINSTDIFDVPKQCQM